MDQCSDLWQILTLQSGCRNWSQDSSDQTFSWFVFGMSLLTVVSSSSSSTAIAHLFQGILYSLRLHFLWVCCAKSFISLDRTQNGSGCKSLENPNLEWWFYIFDTAWNGRKDQMWESDVIHTCAVLLVFGQLKTRSALAWHPTFEGSFSADVSTSMVFVHAVHSICSKEGDNETQSLFIVISELDWKVKWKFKNLICSFFKNKSKERKRWTLVHYRSVMQAFFSEHMGVIW